MSKHFLLVGQGIAGTCLALSLLKEGKKITIVDSEPATNASRVAAGMYNPIVFKRLTCSWMADELIPALNDFYDYWATEFNSTFHNKTSILKMLSIDERTFWEKQSRNSDAAFYLDSKIITCLYQDATTGNAGLGQVNKSGWINTTLFLDVARNYLKKFASYHCLNFAYNDLTITEGHIEWQGIKYDKIIFCEGYRMLFNPWFKGVGLQTAKGDVLKIKYDHPLHHVLSKNLYIVPLGNNEYKVGATYNWTDQTESITTEGLEELKNKIASILKHPFEVISQEAGVRPATRDRRPIIGFHPHYPQLGIFNGMGTKGIMLAPYWARHFADTLTKKTPLNSGIDVKRFY